ncbi:MAG TPA: phosphatase PAP2 family protein, partial [Candidatus Dormibacteraeota bacterium]|nr:phosphatase PAP2 family protein [Candidatus Dormibacteraeota bacterium]
MTTDHAEPATPPASSAGSRVDAGPDTESGPLGRVDPKQPKSSTQPTPRPPLGLATGVLVVAAAGLIASLVVLGFIAEGVRDQEVFALDAWATPFLHSIQSPNFNALMNGLTTMGTTLIVLPVLLVVGGGLLVVRRYGAFTFLLVSLGGSMAIDAIMKLIFQRPRPKLDYAAVLPDYSFPSGHAMNGVAFYVAIALILWSVFGRKVGVISLITASVLTFGIGVSRIYLGYHFLTDVVGGWLAGITWLMIVGAVFRLRPSVWTWGRRGRPP